LKAFAPAFRLTVCTTITGPNGREKPLMIKQTPRFFWTTRVALLAAAVAVIARAQSAPSVDDAKRAIDQAQQKLWKALGTPGVRTVLFQRVQAGASSSPGSYPFEVTLLIHECSTGYPANHYYGKTLVGKIEAARYELSADDFGAWQVQGKMTPNLSDSKITNNTAAGTCAVSVDSLQGSRAPAGGAASSGARAATPPSATIIPVARGAGAAASAGVALGSYLCWANGQARLLLNFTILENNQYRDHNGTAGTYRMDSNARMTFQGGNLDRLLPAGSYYLYHSPQGRPTVSFRNSGGSEVTFCQRH
jgi:hypothetical protein